MQVDPRKYIKACVRAQPSYVLKAQRARVKLNQNENAFGFPEELLPQVWERARQREWGRYPDQGYDKLIAALSRRVDLPPEQLLVANGSNTLIQCIAQVCLGPKDVAVTAIPGFSLYALYTRIQGGHITEVPLNRADFSFDHDLIARRTRQEKARLVFLCSPNNPTGSAISLADLDRLLSEVDALVVADEAYCEFSDQDFRPLLDRHTNLVILRTFSKALAMAGLRFGYLMAQADLLREIAKARTPYNLNVFSESAALVALENPGPFQNAIIRLREERDWLYAEFAETPGMRAYPSEANFILFEPGAGAKRVHEALIERGISVRDVTGYPMLENALRVTVGTRAENEEFVGALREVAVR